VANFKLKTVIIILCQNFLLSRIELVMKFVGGGGKVLSLIFAEQLV